MPPPGYLLDTGILLHWVRGSSVAAAIDREFELRRSPLRPLICEVTLGEIEAFARAIEDGRRRSGNDWPT
jgi:hypothetical protein